MLALSQGALNGSKWWLLTSYLSISARVWRSGFWYDSQFFGVESLRSFLWNVGADICWADGFYHERGSAICPCAEREFLILLERSTRRHLRIQVWLPHPPSFYFGVCNSLDHDLVTGTTAQTHTVVPASMVFSSSSVCLSSLNPHSSLSRCLTLALVWIGNSNSLSMRSLPSYHWYHY